MDVRRFSEALSLGLIEAKQFGLFLTPLNHFSEALSLGLIEAIRP